MPTKREREYYRMGFEDAAKLGFDAPRDDSEYERLRTGGRRERSVIREKGLGFRAFRPKKPKRKLSAWNKFVKANAKKPRFRLRSGAPNLKKLGVAFRKTPAGRKKRR